MTNEADESSKRVVFLTGSSGFLGGVLAKQLQSDTSVAKIYCPIWIKKGMLGADRLAQCLGSCNKCIHLEMDDAIPSDTTHVILNAYSTRFDEELSVKLEGSVAPTLKLLEDCYRLKESIQGITFVSTAYVQPPLPYRSDEKGRIPFLLESSHSSMTAKQVYDVALRSDTAAIAELLQDLDPYYRNNSYLFSKHLMEHLLTEQYHDLPVCIVRPSLICPSLDLQDGWTTRSSVFFLASIAPRYIFMSPRCKGKVNLVLVEDVTKDCIEAVFKLARPASKDGNGQLWHPIISSTAHSNTTVVLALFKATAPHVPRMDIRKEWLLNLVRKIEFSMVSLSAGQNAARKLEAAYGYFDYTHANTWEFECRHSEQTPQTAIESVPRYYLSTSNSKTVRQALGADGTNRPDGECVTTNL